jgi:hypothetical protein
MDRNLDNMTPEERTRIDNLAWLQIPTALLRIVNSQVDSGEDSPKREGPWATFAFSALMSVGSSPSLCQSLSKNRRRRPNRSPQRRHTPESLHSFGPQVTSRGSGALISPAPLGASFP